MENKQNSNVFYLDGKDGRFGTKRSLFDPTPYIEEETLQDDSSGGDKMENDKILEKYIESVDKDRREMEKRLTEDRREMERRLTEERRLSEDRIDKRMDQVLNTVEKYSTDIKLTIDKIETKVEENSKHVRSLALTTLWSVIGVSVALIALMITVILSI